ncbi:MAG: type I 3-dehydroquinate dehydratase [Lentisphaeraceae bacterium]|nr:type I 3-dehydroquinate dehydratase [Lentisphaeraceae bacterium]
MNSFHIVGTVSKTSTLNDMLQQVEKLEVCDIIELRFDETMNFHECLTLCQKLRLHKKILLTIRTSREGGTWDICDNERYELFARFAPHVDYIDIELKSELFAKYSRQDFPDTLKVIGSFHDYDNTPANEDIAKLILSGRQWNLDIIKLACFTKTAEDYTRLESFLTEKNICLIGMGEVGVKTRSEFPLKGSVFTYGYLDECAAPGQLSARQLHTILRNTTK